VKIHIIDPYIGQLHLTPTEWANEASMTFNMSERVADIAGEAFDVYEWYDGWRSKNNITDLSKPTHLRVVAIDEFTALIPWGQLNQAAMQFAINGEKLSKGYPIRLYVPNGSSDCLNVKGVVRVELLYDSKLGNDATYGFKNEIKLEDMILQKGE